MPDLFVAPKKKHPRPKQAEKPARNASTSAADGKVKTATETTPAKLPKPKSVNLLSSIITEPANVHFENQEEKEHIYMFLRRHPLTNVPWILGAIALILVPPIFFTILPFIDFTFFEVSGRYTLVLLLFYYLIVFGFVFINYVIWFYNAGLITNLRVVDIDISHIASKNVAATSIGDIVDVEYSQSGFLSNLFNFGNIHMQTEGIKPNFEFLNVPKPAEIADLISDLIRGAKE